MVVVSVLWRRQSTKYDGIQIRIRDPPRVELPKDVEAGQSAWNIKTDFFFYTDENGTGWVKVASSFRYLPAAAN